MAPQLIRAVYQEGWLRLVDPVHLDEGEEVQIVILSAQEQVRKVLADLLAHPVEPAAAEIDEEALLQEIAVAFEGQPPLSATILEERRQGP